jgi:Zn-finger nucleic acid-binding protein
MKCPLCADTALVMADRQGVEIDYCPQCRGVWLDRGELDKLIALAGPAAPTAPAARHPVARRPDFVDSDHDHVRPTRGEVTSPSAGGRKKSWLGDFFD